VDASPLAHSANPRHLPPVVLTRKAMTHLFRLLVVAFISLTLIACASSGGSQPGALYAGNTNEGQPRPLGNASAQRNKGVVPAVVGLPPDPGPANTYRIAPHDLLQIEVFQVGELSSEERVNEEGFIAMSLIGAVMVGGLTPQEAEDRIADILGENYLQDPQVNIFVKEYANQNVTVAGAVNKPGVFPLKGRTTLLQAVAMAEGVTRVANDNEVVIFRSQSGRNGQAYVVDLERVQDGALPDPVLVADDRVIVPESGTAVFIQNFTGSLRGLVSLNPLLY